MNFLKTAGAVLALALIVPLTVWIATGSLSHAWFSLKRYALAMAVIVVPVLVVVGITLFPFTSG